ncbi:hypothetical protein F4556_005033 [Kitasatospora gansuensis]|uniref:Uncharacterized protein n=1 Tax=Kitasatospora gansuensis TaxID=258050 RepID=A0A7W7WJT2_9ACTN|nr:hypothetical protein [Kitasatospora gansuensis]MBB4949498.1 hypothetical protein [Kitasatospora gansuensis]
MSRPPQLVLSPLIGVRPKPQSDPAAYSPAVQGHSFLVVPLAVLHRAPATRLPLRQRKPPSQGSASSGAVFPAGPVRRTRAAGLAAWFNGASTARSRGSSELADGDGLPTPRNSMG